MSMHFTNSEWQKINQLFATADESNFGLPTRRNKSVVISTFNIRSLGTVKNRTSQSWSFLTEICSRCDLVAIQEVKDNLAGLRKIKDALGDKFGLVVSDVTGVNYGRGGGSPERLAFLFRWDRISRMELASDISYDRTAVIDSLKEDRLAWNKYLRNSNKYDKAQAAYKAAKKHAKANGLPAPPKPTEKLPEPPGFLTFIRQPHTAAFEITAKGQAKPIQFMAVNTHLNYGDFPSERAAEFEALIQWLTLRAKRQDRMYYDNMILLGDCNLDFKDANIKRTEIDQLLKDINAKELKNKKAAKVNFPLLDAHPVYGQIRTNARRTQTYDQIGIFIRDQRLPDDMANDNLTLQPDDYNYGCFNFVDLFAQALFQTPFDQLAKSDWNHIIDRTQWDVSDHMPAWIRLPIPGA